MNALFGSQIAKFNARQYYHLYGIYIEWKLSTSKSHFISKALWLLLRQKETYYMLYM